MTEAEKEYEVVLYVKQSQALIAPWHWGQEMKRPFKEMGTWSGHAFVGIREVGGENSEKIYGFGGAKGYEEYKDKYPDEKLVWAVTPGKVISGIVVTEYGERVPDTDTIGQNYEGKISPHDAKIVYKVTLAQKEAVEEFIRNKESNPPGYNLFGYSCVHFAFEALKAANLQPPTKMPVLYTPTVAAWNIEKMKIVEEVRDTLHNAHAKLQTIFSPDRKVPAAVLNPDVKPYSFKDIRKSRPKDKSVSAAVTSNILNSGR